MQSQPGGHGDDELAKEMEGPVRKLNDCVGMVGFSFAWSLVFYGVVVLTHCLYVGVRFPPQT